MAETKEHPPFSSGLHETDVACTNSQEVEYALSHQELKGMTMERKSIHILLIEDEEAHAELILGALKSRADQVQVTVVATLQKALASIAASTPDLAIVDIHLLDGNGLDILPADKNDVVFPVVVLTASGDEQAAVEAMKRGALDYVVKSRDTLADVPHIVGRALREWNSIKERKLAERALLNAHDELETRVRRRTEELAAANDQLRKEIAERTRAEEAQRESEQRFRLAFESGPLGMAIFSVDRKLLHVNNALCQMLGYTREELIGKPCNDLIHPDDREATSIRARQIRSGEISGYTTEIRHLSKAGQPIWTRGSVGSMRNQDGKMKFGLAMIENISEHKLTQERAEKLRVDLAHLGRVHTMGEMASGIAHELNQPLGVIVMRAEVAAQRVRLGINASQEKLLDALEDVANEAHRAGQIIRRMRDFVKKAEPHRSTIDLAEVISEVLALVQSDLRHAEIPVATSVDPSLPTLLADKIQVQQVLLNLIRNAMEAMDHTAIGPHRLTLRASADKETLEVAVSDTGCGIPDGHLDDLFGTFYSTKPAGMGVGLAISRSIIEGHGGRIWARQNADRGATFTFTLPIAKKD